MATLAELCIVACSEAFRGNGEVIATGVGPVPRLAAGLAKLTHSPGLMMTDGEAYLVEEPVPLGPRGDYRPKFAGHLPFSRFFDSAVWTGRRHAMVTPTQIDRFGQINLSQLGGTDHAIRVISLHPGVTFEQVQEATGFALEQGDMAETPMPTAEQLQIIGSLDPHGIRASVIKDNPPARGAA